MDCVSRVRGEGRGTWWTGWILGEPRLRGDFPGHFGVVWPGHGCWTCSSFDHGERRRSEGRVRPDRTPHLHANSPHCAYLGELTRSGRPSGWRKIRASPRGLFVLASLLFFLFLPLGGGGKVRMYRVQRQEGEYRVPLVAQRSLGIRGGGGAAREWRLGVRSAMRKLVRTGVRDGSTVLGVVVLFVARRIGWLVACLQSGWSA